MPDGMKLVLYADEDAFEHDKQQDGDVFVYTGDSAADDTVSSLEVSFAFATPPGGIEALAGRFLSGYLDGGESTVGGEGPIKRSSLKGVFVSGVKGAETYEAWIHGLQESSVEGLAVVFVIKYSTDEQKNALYAILDTLEMVPA